MCLRMCVCVSVCFFVCSTHTRAYKHTRANKHTSTRAYIHIQTSVVKVVSGPLPLVMCCGVRASATRPAPVDGPVSLSLLPFWISPSTPGPNATTWSRREGVELVCPEHHGTPATKIDHCTRKAKARHAQEECFLLDHPVSRPDKICKHVRTCQRNARRRRAL